ncbi:MAG: WHG domain-containing protein [Pseudomonadota bacterium]
MSAKTEAKRAALRDSLVDAAEGLIAQNGLRGLKARDITARAGCALGALYNAVDGLDQLIVLVNSRTLTRLGEKALAEVPADGTGADKMRALGRVYAAFAVENPYLWSAVFTHRLPEGQSSPDWHRAEFMGLIEQVAAPLADLRPDLDGATLRLRAQTLFAAVHGVVQLSIHGFEVGAPRDVLFSEVDALVGAMMRGIR